MLETSAKGAQPRGEEAQRVLSVFAASLKNPTLVRGQAFPVGHVWRIAMCRPTSGARLHVPAPPPSGLPHLVVEQETPPAIEDMLSWNTLTPHYEEDVIYALNSASVARHFGMDPVSAQVGGMGRSG